MDIANTNVIIPLAILAICGIVVWFTQSRHRRKQQEIAAEREYRRNASRPSSTPRANGASLPGATQAVPAVVPPPVAPPPSIGVSPSTYQPPEILANGHAQSTNGLGAPPHHPSPPSWQPPAPIGAGMPSSPPPPAPVDAVRPPVPPAPADDIVWAPKEAAPPQPPTSLSHYVVPDEDVEEWLELYAGDVESWVLNHEKILDEVTIEQRNVDDVSPNLLAQEERLEDRLDHGARTHPSRQQGAELLEMLNAADETLRATREADYDRAEANHARYLSYREIWLPRVQRSLQR